MGFRVWDFGIREFTYCLQVLRSKVERLGHAAPVPDEDLEYTLLNKRDVMEPASGSLHSELWGWWLLVQYV